MEYIIIIVEMMMWYIYIDTINRIFDNPGLRICGWAIMEAEQEPLPQETGRRNGSQISRLHLWLSFSCGMQV